MIKLMKESVSGPLAKALNQADQKYKRSLMYNFSRNDIDFDKSIGNAEKISANDPRLQVDGNIVIGIFTDANGKTCMTTYQVGTGTIGEDSTASITMVKDNSGKTVNLPNFDNVSWRKWVSIMTDFYIIEKDKAVPVQSLRRQRYSNRDVDLNVSDAWTNKVKEIANRYGYEISLFKSNSMEWLDITITNTDRSSKIGVRYDMRYGFTVHTVGSDWTEDEAIKMRDDMTKAINMIHKLNQINLDKVGNIK